MSAHSELNQERNRNGDLLTAISTLQKEKAELEKRIGELEALRFTPTGDNHHNALKCPYCNPGRIDPAAERQRREECEKQLAEIKTHYEERWAKDATEDMACGALNAIQTLLDSGDVPRGTFADDQVRNLVAMYNNERQRREECEAVVRIVANEEVTFVEFAAAHVAARTYFSRYPSESDNRTKVAG